MRLGGKVAIITGAASGIGRASALLFGREGARIIDAAERLVLPGLVDAHVHNSQMLARGISDDGPIPNDLPLRVLVMGLLMWRRASRSD